MSKTIIHFVKKYWPATGGIQTHVHELSKAQANSDEEKTVHIATLSQGGLIEKKADYPVTGHNISPWELPISKNHILNQSVNSITISKQLHKIRQDINANVLHIHDLPFELIPFVKFGIPNNVTLVITVHSSYFLNNRGSWLDYLFKQLLQNADYIIAPSRELRRETEIIVDSSKVESIEFIPNGVPAQFFTERTPKSSDHYQVLCPRRLVEKNGVKYMAESIKYIDSSLESFDVIFAGDGPERSKIRSILKESNQLQNATLLGEVDYDRMPQLYSDADVSVFPSLKEATSIAALESMASGTPVVATDVGGLPQIINNGEQGKIVSAKEPKELANAIVDIIKSNNYRKLQQSAQYQARQYSWEKIVSEKLPY